MAFWKRISAELDRLIKAAIRWACICPEWRMVVVMRGESFRCPYCGRYYPGEP